MQDRMILGQLQIATNQQVFVFQGTLPGQADRCRRSGSTSPKYRQRHSTGQAVDPRQPAIAPGSRSSSNGLEAHEIQRSRQGENPACDSVRAIYRRTADRGHPKRGGILAEEVRSNKTGPATSAGPRRGSRHTNPTRERGKVQIAKFKRKNSNWEAMTFLDTSPSRSVGQIACFRRQFFAADIAHNKFL